MPITAIPDATTVTGTVTTSPSSSFMLEIARGNVSNMSLVHKFGHNPDIDTASNFEDIWGGGGYYTGFDATAAETVEIFSSDAADDVAGTGALSIQMYGLDANWEEQDETLVLTGATAVDSANTYIRCNRAIVRTAGSGGENAGEITIRQKTTTANVFAKVPAGYNQTMISCYTVPAGKCAYMTGWFCALSGRTNADSVVKLLARPTGEVFQVKEKVSLQGNGTTVSQRSYDIPKGCFIAKTDIKIHADTDVNNTGLSAGFDLILVDA